MIWLRSALFNLGFYLWTLVVGTGLIPTLVMPAQVSIYGQRFWARGVVFLMRYVAGITYEVRGVENIPHGASLVASKHQSAFDTVVFPLMIRDPVLVLKRELIYIPFYGWYAVKWGMIPVDRKTGPSALRSMLKAARPVLAQGRPIFIFPEGTRMAPGAAPDYKPGVAALYRELKVPCVPVALNSGLYWPRRTIRKNPGRIIVEFLPPIPPGLSRPDFMARLQSDIETATTRLVAEGNGHQA